MKKSIDIPEEWRILVECLRCAIHDVPPGNWIRDAKWNILLRQARGHCVECFLFPWLCKFLPEQFSAHASVPGNCAEAAWRSFALEHLSATFQRQQQMKDILSTFAKNKVELIPLKGIWLSEVIYSEPSQRKMVDIDLLVRKSDIDRAVKLLTEIGYISSQTMTDSEYMYNLSFYQPERRTFIELHWNVESIVSGANEIPEIETIIQRTVAVNLFEYPVRIFAIEDQLCHLVQHILHHQFALSLKAYVDIALLYKSEGDKIEINNLINAARDWKTGMAIPFVLQMVSTLFNIEIPAEQTEHNTDHKTEQEAIRSIFVLPEASSRIREVNLLRYRDASFIGRMQIILERIFMPQSFMQLQYPFVRNPLLLPAAWFLRSLSLIKSCGINIISVKKSDKNLNNAAIRAEIIKKLTGNR